MNIAKCAEEGCRANATCSVPHPGAWTGATILMCDTHAEAYEALRETVKATAKRGGAK